ncbi:death-associated inhibitor of apoptosis 2 [Calliopsis andreniformis]|uniref:death-associated inhibitor of apoptosis 2 n=1 Tax=Calliopsis andreniformis TaxID=337506 RepID=UPI003FCEACF4
MNVEENRLQTFSEWPANATVDATRIAKAGFYYSGRGMEVQCFLCGTKISDWNYGDQAMVRHRQAAPDCPFVQNPSNTCNVPLIPISTNESGLMSSSREVSQENDTVEHPSVTSFLQNQDSTDEYKTVSQRLETFATWPIPSIVSPEKLAKAGFYYLQHDDTVQCVYCKGIVRKWKPGDDPDKEHRIHFPKCDFYMHQDDTLYLNNVKLMPGTTSSLTELGVQEHTGPKKLRYATYEGRLHTFAGWPENLKQTPEMLASAGFYYTGFGDHVRCFHCDGGLRNWETTDGAWTEHARWFPKCEFVNLVRGQEFIKQCIDNRPPLDPSIFEGAKEDEDTEIVETLSTSLPTIVPPTQEITESAVERLLDSSPARNALEIGLQVGRVKRAIKKRLERTGVPYTDSNQLIEDVLHEQMMEDDTRNEVITTVNHLISEQTDNALGTSNDDEENNSHQDINEGENEILVNEEDKPITSDVEDNTFENRTSGRSKETTSLEEENRRLREARLCKICMDREVAVVFLPCGHLATCVHCAPSLIYCPMCRREIRATVRTFLS